MSKPRKNDRLIVGGHDLNYMFRAADGDVVRRCGKVFEAGEYPDKGVEFTEQDLAEAVSKFAPVDNDLEHEPTVLDGKLGRLERVWQSGKELFGEVAVPKWLDAVLGEDPLKVSLAFDRDKSIVGNALVLNPRISDAAVFAAFNNHSQRPGSGQEPRNNMPTKMKLSDYIASHVKSIFGMDKVDPEAEVEVAEGGTEAKPKEPAAPATPAAPAATPAAPATPEVPAEFKAELDKLRNENNVLFALSVKNAAYAFADTVIRDKKALPSQRESIADMYVKANGSDANGGATFTAAGAVEGVSVGALKKFFADAPAHALTEEQLASGHLLFAGEPDGDEGGDKGMNPAKKKRLLAATATGKAAMEANAKENKS